MVVGAIAALLDQRTAGQPQRKPTAQIRHVWETFDLASLGVIWTTAGGGEPPPRQPPSAKPTAQTVIVRIMFGPGYGEGLRPASPCGKSPMTARPTRRRP